MALMTTREVADLLKVSPRTLQRWRLTGLGPAFIRFNDRSVRYAPADVRQWMVDHGKA